VVLICDRALGSKASTDRGTKARKTRANKINKQQWQISSNRLAEYNT